MNLKKVQDYPNLEIVLLDYNSQDGMDKWVKTNLLPQLKRKKMVYYKTFEPQSFSHSHAKNMAFKLATGDIVCNINADSFMGRGLVWHINRLFHQNRNSFLFPSPRLGFDSGSAGVVCVRKEDFLRVGGFDERFKVYGWEDADFNNRLQHLGLEKVTLACKAFLYAIDHKEKYNSEQLIANVHTVYLGSTTPMQEAEVKALILYKDATFKSGIIVNNLIKSMQDKSFASAFNEREHQYTHELSGTFWQEGYWNADGQDIVLLNKAHSLVGSFRKVAEERLESRADQQPVCILYPVTDPELLSLMLYFQMDYDNRLIMISNIDDKTTEVNEGNFGQGIVFRNFDLTTPIRLS
ncbi:hypothetical protein ABIE50_004310 [Chitinophaga sp. OAE865]